MALEIEGKVQKVLEAKTGETKNGKTWQKQDFIIETLGEYPKKVCRNGFFLGKTVI